MEKFSFAVATEKEIITLIKELNISKPTTFNTIPAKVILEICNIFAPYIATSYKNSILNVQTETSEITPVYKQFERILKDNYRPVSILPIISKIFERNMYTQINTYMEKYFSMFFIVVSARGYSAQYCLIAMLEKWRKSLDGGNIDGAILTNLSKAFDCLNHKLLISKLDAYGFDHKSLSLIYSYLSDKHHRTKVNNSFSTWEDISSGVPQAP